MLQELYIIDEQGTLLEFYHLSLTRNGRPH